MGMPSSRTSTRRNLRTLFTWLLNFGTEIRLYSAARLVACKGLHRLHGSRMWESREFGEYADRNLLVSCDGSEDSKETQKGWDRSIFERSLSRCVLSAILLSSCNKLDSWEGKLPRNRRFQELSSVGQFRSSAVSMTTLTSSSRLTRCMLRKE